MKFFLDTANLEEIRTAHRWGILDGVTTNPTLVAREGKDYRTVVREIAAVTDGPISVEATTDRAEEMIAQGREYATWAPSVVVKVPATTEGIMAAAALTREGIRVNVTLVFSVNQALLAARAGAYFVSPFVGRLDDAGHEGMQVVRDVVQVYRTYGFSTQVLAASLRHPLHVTQAALAGAHIATMPFKVAEMLFTHPLTEAGQERFLADWRALQAALAQRRTPV
ncbi:MAG: fructose-6-phosphate aldolase [Armatimonadota bacterium]|nr:fructose-6-phosphate aldolase [Armatimonadota bacterium]MDR7401911.1 fructose-6-phosphate aldolase [Armatimonadota bacterium]MDR7404819.1 fructose-6-phosphate aldolase [Armatimonadota bacterium]MDR7438106.1 fructose-6-phosphate aldolase [Armatimonadota bacterium]MDR7471538.1 fructose-6-phosphate aldolase [Armatimonadota bacterium]